MISLSAVGIAPPGAAGDEHRIVLDEVFEVLPEAAEKEVEGIEFKEVEPVSKTRYKVYESEGIVARRRYDVGVTVAPEGNVLTILEEDAD